MEVILAAATAFFATALAVPLTIAFAKKFNMVDDPAKRPHPAHIQKRIIPRAGGLAIYLGFIAAALTFLPITQQLLGIIAGASILLIVGLVDDRIRQFNPYLRLALLFSAAAAPVLSGIGISFISNPFAFIPVLPQEWQGSILHLNQIIIVLNFLGEHKIILLADLFALFWIVTLTQIVNWSKGVDGQMAGITLVTAITLGLLSLKFYFQGDASQLTPATLAFITAGASLGFLLFNWHPSKIIPGFSGSTILAFLLAVTSILSTGKVATALLVLAIPTADFVYTVIRRILSGRSPVWGDRGHLHHRLLDIGWSHSRISLFYILISVILGAIALQSGTASKLFAAATATAAFLTFIVWLNSRHEPVKREG